MKTFELSVCGICGGTGWGSPYSTPRDGQLVRVMTPCSVHGAWADVPDAIYLPSGGAYAPKIGVNYVVQRGTCSVCEAATRNGVCTVLSCENGPKAVAQGARVWTLDHVPDAVDRAVYIVCEDFGDTFTVMGWSGAKNLLIRIPKTGWGAIGFRPFPESSLAAPAASVERPLCGALRPMDGKTRCNRDAEHDYDHMLLDDPQPDGTSGATYRPALATWAQDGTETCSGCGYRLDKSGMCTAPLSVAD